MKLIYIIVSFIMTICVTTFANITEVPYRPTIEQSKEALENYCLKHNRRDAFREIYHEDGIKKCKNAGKNRSYDENTISTCDKLRDENANLGCVSKVGEIFADKTSKITPTAKNFCISNFKPAGEKILGLRLECFEFVGLNKVTTQGFDYCSRTNDDKIICLKQFVNRVFTMNQLLVCEPLNKGNNECLGSVKNFEVKPLVYSTVPMESGDDGGLSSDSRAVQ